MRAPSPSRPTGPPISPGPSVRPPGGSELTALRADLKRYGSRAFLREPSAYAVAVYRLGRWNDSRQGSGLGRRAGRLVYLVAHMAVRVSLGIEIPKEAVIGPGLRIHHQGPVVLHPNVRAGSNLTLRHGITLGERRRAAGVPTIGDDVEIGAYAQLLGPITVGDGAAIGALALVIDDVPAGDVVTAPTGTVRPRADRSGGGGGDSGSTRRSR